MSKPTLVGVITIRVYTKTPANTDAEIEKEGEKFETFQERIELACNSFVPPSWDVEVKTGVL